MRKLNVTILVGLVVAVLGFGMVFAYGSRVDARVAEGKATVAVLVATEPVAAGTNAADLAAVVEPREIPQAYVAEGALTSLDAVSGQVLLGPVGKDAQVTAAQFGQPGSTASVNVAPGRVALAVGVSLTAGGAHYVTPGSTVDVFVTYTSTSGADGENANAGRTKLFASGVKVLSVNAAGVEGDGASTEQVVAVLDLAPADAEKVVNAATLGSLYLALSSADGQPHVTDGATADDVVGSNR